MTKQIPLTQGLSAIVDDEDFEELSKHKWYAVRCYHNKNFRAARDLNGKNTLMHRLIMNAREGMEVDHIDGNPLNNTRSNLRLCTTSQNMHNRKKQSNNTSGFKGVSKINGRWNVQIQANKKQYHLGTFDTPIDAARAYNRAALKYHGEFARLNVIPEGK